MVYGRICRRNSWSYGQWWRWVYSSTTPSPPFAAFSSQFQRATFFGDLARVKDHSFANSKTPSLVIIGGFPRAPVWIRGRFFTSQVMANVPVDRVVDVPLAQTGEGIAECELLKWFVQEGESVEEFQPLCEVQSDKATIEITSRYKGKVSEVLHVPGNIVKVGETLLKMVLDENTFENQSLGVLEIIEGQECNISQLKAADAMLRKSNSSGVLTTPAVRSFAKQLDVNIEDVHGTGKDGRILKEDVLNYTSRKGALGENCTSLNDCSAEQYHGEDEKFPDVSPVCELKYKDLALPLRGFQRAMVKSMTLAAKIPHFHYVEEITCDTLIELKTSFQNENSDPSIKFTFLPMLIKSLSMALRKYPLMNSCFNEESQEVILKGSHNIGIAMATPNGLVVPNIKKVQSLSILEITKELSRLQELALANKLSADDISGGSTTISNIGSIGGKFGSPLINVPEASIIALGRIQKIPHFDEDGNVSPASVMTINIGADHRVLDGATVARFCNEWKLYIEKPEMLMLHMR